MLNFLRLFAEDPKVRALFALIVLDFLLGVFAAIKRGEFRLSYVADFMKSDVAGKLAPYALLVLVLRLAGDIEIPGLPLGLIETGAFGLIALAMAGSVMSSLKDLGIAPKLPDSIAGPEQPDVQVVVSDSSGGEVFVRDTPPSAGL